MDNPTPINHVFVDFENVHEVDLSLIGQKSIHVTVLLGSNQTKLASDLVEKLLQHAGSVHLVRLTEKGRNAVDFALAYYVGRASVFDPSGFYHVISKDTGYDPLISHLRGNHVRARRHESFDALKETFNQVDASGLANEPLPLPPVKQKPTPAPKAVTVSAAKTNPLDDRSSLVLEHLRSHEKNRPSKEKTLVHHIPTILGKGATEVEAQQVIQSLRAAGKISISDKGRVEYHL